MTNGNYSGLTDSVILKEKRKELSVKLEGSRIQAHTGQVCCSPKYSHTVALLCMDVSRSLGQLSVRTTFAITDSAHRLPGKVHRLKSRPLFLRASHKSS